MASSRRTAHGARLTSRLTRLLAWIVPCAVSLVPGAMIAQDVSLEYRVKAAYLFNFAKFVEWPPAARRGALTICVAGRNVFGDALERTVTGESVDGRPLAVRVILEPMDGCHILFVPRGAAAPAYLRASQDAPVLTGGEMPRFIDEGGVANFVLEGTNVRFEISQPAAERVGLRISSRLLRLARLPGAGL
jgi:hypothetical protein